MLKKILMIFFIIALLLIALVVLAYATTDGFSRFGASPSGARLERIKQSPLYDGKQFQNPADFGPDNLGVSFSLISRWLFGKEIREPEHELPVISLDRNSFADKPEPGLRVTWLGHSTALLEIDGYRILTDPVLAERCSPSSIIGPKRFHPVPIQLEDLPPLDAVLISHDHHDHLDMRAIQYLKATGVIFITTLGIGAHLEKWGVDSSRIVELDWWQATNVLNDVSVIATPARHFSGRVAITSNKTLWASFAIVGPEHRAYFSGDAGLLPGFKEIGSKFGPFDLTMIEAGAYDETWPTLHLNPEQAIEAHIELKGRVFLPIHWGTFNIAYHRWDEPIEWSLKAAAEHSVTIITPQPGQTIDINNPPPIEHWWKEK